MKYFEVFCYNKSFKIDLHSIMENNKRPDFKVYNNSCICLKNAEFGESEYKISLDEITKKVEVHNPKERVL
jgi:hypothetical protein